ncbi:methylmalonyl-CoA mutase family protein [Pontibacter sp. G13]|uniref:methylmalonyl-CoA mutase family protein n=1 Tax=Pontibacter sp. G13 TaxID=3074898 RepID=UPI00288C26FE|nr:methylmalonyl-CoA mutase family protein [Pontibacter sp. G13]WNJ20372.1 methylmalonyl-CoA mutase family protein [Pontibacter sp. G13]
MNFQAIRDMEHTPENSLFADFPSVSTQAWMDKLIKDLKGKTLESLDWEPAPGLSLKPIYRSENLDTQRSDIHALPGSYPFRRGGAFANDGEGWQMVQTISTGTHAQARMSEALEGEIRAFRLVSEATQQDFAEFKPVVNQIDLAAQALHLVMDQAPSLTAADLYMELATKDIPASLLTGTLTYDPINAAGASKEPINANGLAHAAAGVHAFRKSKWFRSLGMDLRWVQDQGGTPVHELAIALATAVEYLDQAPRLVDSITLEDVLDNMAFTFGTGTLFFVEIAKYRAFRMLFAKVAQAFGAKELTQLSPFVMATTATNVLSIYDRYNNLLRTTTAAMSAILGGAEAVSVPAFDVVSNGGDATSDRLARNIQHLLKHESHLDQVVDAAGGAYYIEQTTDALAEEAWALFQSIEAEGGILAALQSGIIHQWISMSQARQAKEMSTRKRVQVGVNKYPNTGETLERAAESLAGDTRAAATFEQLRLQVDAASEAQGKRLNAGLWLFGPTKWRNARSQFARNLLGTAGIDISENTTPADWEASLTEWTQAKPDILVLCSADEAYGDLSIEAIKSAIPGVQILIAGHPKKVSVEGADGYVFSGMDAVSFLSELVQPFIQPANS